MKGYKILLVLFLVIGSELARGSGDDVRRKKTIKRRRVKTTTTSPITTTGTTDWYHISTENFTADIETTNATELTTSEPSTTTSKISNEEIEEATTPTKETVTTKDETTTAPISESTVTTSEPSNEGTEEVTTDEATTTGKTTTGTISESTTTTSEPSNEGTEEATTDEATTTDKTTTGTISESTTTTSEPSNEGTEEVTTDEATTTDKTTTGTISESTTTTSEPSNEGTEEVTTDEATTTDKTTTGTISESTTTTSEPSNEGTEEVTTDEATTTDKTTTGTISESTTTTSEPSNEGTEEVTTDEATTTDKTTTGTIRESTTTTSEPSHEGTEEVTTDEATTTDKTTTSTISESTTTTSEPSHEETEEVRTLTPSTTSTPYAPASKCPAPKSQLSATDLIVLISYVADEMHVYESINNSYYDDAVNMRDQHATSLNSFMEWFEDRPHHLKHTLENLKHTQSRIQLNMDKVNTLLRHTPAIREFYEAQYTVTNLQTEVNNIKWNCKCTRRLLSGYVELAAEEKEGNNEVTPEQPDATTENYQCGALADIYMTIKTNLEDFVKDFKEELNNQIKNDNKAHTEEIENLKNSLKKAALNSFGRTMYDILNLIDSYNHLEHDLNVENVNKIISSITETNHYVVNQVWYLRQQINAKRYQCQNCVHYSKLARLRQSDIEGIQEENNDLLIKLMDSHKTEIKNKIMYEYTEIFKDLRDIISSRNEDYIQEYINYLKPIQDEVNAITKLETEKLKSLRNKEAYGKLLYIEKERATLYNSVEAIKKQLNNFLI